MAASGLRACRYALEVPFVQKVIANDFDAAACEAIRLNAEFNGCLPKMEITNADARYSEKLLLRGTVSLDFSTFWILISEFV